MSRIPTRTRRSVRTIVAAAIVCSAVLSFGPAAGAATSLSVVPSPNRPAPSRASVVAVGCASATLCFGVGSGSDGSIFIEQWNGTTWTTVASPKPVGASGGSLADVACASTTSCFAVGRFSVPGNADATLIEQWNGTSWAVVASPNLPSQYSSSLTGVSCLSASSCVAVGRDLIEQWDGTTWSLADGPNPVESVDNNLTGVSCATATSCFAVGSVGFSSTFHGEPKTLTERWNGTSWTIVASLSPKAKFGFGDELANVSCASPTSCFAVGHAGADVLVEHWNGTGWSVSAVPNLTVGGSLNGLTCTSATNCFAVGSMDTTTVREPPLVERWNGTRWSIVNSPSPGTRGSLSAVSCATAASCVAVGSYQTTSSNQRFAEQWNGTSWAITPAPRDAAQSQLTSTSCPSPKSCFAVGSSFNGVATQTLIEHWNGTTWAIMASPNPAGATTSSLAGVSCVSVTSCFAVGSSYGGARAPGALVERWNGSRWSIVASAKISANDETGLTGVSCASATTCFAVGADIGQAALGLIERWDGKTWTVSAIQRPAGFNTYLLGVSCATATSCAAVGFVGSDLPSQSVLEHWNGKTWSVVVGKTSIRALEDAMTGVSCASATSCIAVGGHTARWNGKTWSKIPNRGGLAVSCVSPASCLAVAGPSAARWNGKTWSPITGPNPDGYLSGVACFSVTKCFAVGSYNASNSTNTLIEQSS